MIIIIGVKVTGESNQYLLFPLSVLLTAKNVLDCRHSESCIIQYSTVTVPPPTLLKKCLLAATVELIVISFPKVAIASISPT